MRLHARTNITHKHATHYTPRFVASTADADQPTVTAPTRRGTLYAYATEYLRLRYVSYSTGAILYQTKSMPTYEYVIHIGTLIF